VAAGAEGLTSDVTTMTEVTALASARTGNNGLKIGCGCESEACTGTHESSVNFQPIRFHVLSVCPWERFHNTLFILPVFLFV
jgi:hypothetical protein